MTADAMTAMEAKNSVCQPWAPARKLNAAPVLNTSTRLKKGASARLSPGMKVRSTTVLVTKSSTITAAASPYQRKALGMPPGLPAAMQIAVAATAQALGVHIRAVVPATPAFRVLARL